MLTTLCSAWRGTFRLSLLLILILTWPTAGRAQDAMARAQQALQAMEVAAGGALTPTLSPVTGLVTFLATHAGSPLPVAVSGGTTPEEVTQAFLAAYGAAFGIDNRADMQVTTIQATDAVGMEHVRLQQLHRGVRVTAGEMTVHLRGPAVIAVHAKTVADLTALDVIPTLPPEEAQAQVHAFIAKRFGISDAVLSEPRLEILNPGLLEDRQTSSYLAWFVQATAPALNEYCWVNAETGGLILHIRQLTDALDRQIYNGGESTILPGMLARSEGDPPTGDADTDNAYTFLGDTYNYYLTDHGRDSVDNAGLTLVATVHSCADPNQPCPLPNAFWNGTQMVFGDGFASADDITAHELTHGVTQYSANLFYYMQSGALNESFSDIFGESVDLTNGRGTDTAAVRWLIGEDLPGIGAFRNMMNPPQFGDPGKVSDTQFRCTSGDADHDGGGVHTNSGVPNHAYALMVDGGTYNGVTITGIGLAKAAKVQYRSLTHYLVSGSNFLDNYNALQQSCADLIGTAGITSADCAEVKKALDVVEMFMTPCPQPPEPALCAVGQTPTNVFFDNAENGGSNWQFGNLWSPVKGFARSGVVSFFGNDTTTPADSRLTLNRDVAIPAAGARMQFSHSFEFEPGFDGGVIEYSTNGGTSWTDAGSLIMAGAQYNTTLPTGFGNPLEGRDAFSFPSFGYTATQLNVASLAGQNVRFRFRIGTDNGNTFFSRGWFIDDIRIYQCTGGGPVTLSVAPSR